MIPRQRTRDDRLAGRRSTGVVPVQERARREAGTPSLPMLLLLFALLLGGVAVVMQRWLLLPVIPIVAFVAAVVDRAGGAR